MDSVFERLRGHEWAAVVAVLLGIFGVALNAYGGSIVWREQARFDREAQARGVDLVARNRKLRAEFEARVDANRRSSNPALRREIATVMTLALVFMLVAIAVNWIWP